MEGGTDFGLICRIGSKEERRDNLFDIESLVHPRTLDVLNFLTRKGHSCGMTSARRHISSRSIPDDAYSLVVCRRKVV